MISRLRFALVTAALASTQLGADGCGGDIISDPGFDLWCGPDLCSWVVERGDIRSVPTWHRGDEGVELLGADTAISQLSRSPRPCMRFAMLADVEVTTDVFLELDLDADGTVEHVERVATTDFGPVEFLLAVVTETRSIKFSLTKRGQGRAVLANIEAEVDTACTGAPIESEPPTDNATLDGSGGRP